MGAFAISFLSILLTLSLLPFFALTGAIAIISLLKIPRKKAQILPSPKHTFKILIPAHNEETIIAKTIAGLQSLNYPQDLFEIIVIADNCIDQTAEIAERSGALVWRRNNLERRGKGFALQFAIDRILADSSLKDLSAVIIIDADTQVDPELLHAFSGRLDKGQDWIQGYYNGSNPDASWRTELLAYALSLINGVWLLGQDRLRIGVSLRGNGMCFSINGLKRQPWHAFGLAEDIEFSWRLRMEGERVSFCPSAKVYGELVSEGGSAAESQRQRWETGRHLMREQFTKEILESRRINFLHRLALLTDLYMMPLSRMVALLIIVMAPQFFGAMVGWQRLFPVKVLILQLFMCISLGLYLISPFIVMGLPFRYLLAIKNLPVFMLWKLRLMFKKAPTSWVRTKREDER